MLLSFQDRAHQLRLLKENRLLSVRGVNNNYFLTGHTHRDRVRERGDHNFYCIIGAEGAQGD
jgi:hypothetical protein